MLGARNEVGLTQREIEYCEQVWQFLCGDKPRPLDTSEAAKHGSRTRYNETQRKVFLGADAYPGKGLTANARLSPLACLAHELAHAERHEAGYDRPIDAPDSFLDEAETSIRASFNPALNPMDREDLVEDARDRLTDWLSHPKEADYEG